MSMQTALLWHRSKSTTTLISVPPDSPRGGRATLPLRPPRGEPELSIGVLPAAPASAEPVQDVQDADIVERAVARDQAHVRAEAPEATTAPVQRRHVGDRLQSQNVRTGGELEHGCSSFRYEVQAATGMRRGRPGRGRSARPDIPWAA